MKTNNEQPPLAQGVFAALATPRQESIEVDAASLLDYLDAVTQAGVSGLVLFGSTGEFIHFDTEERMRVLALAIRRSRIPMLVNVSHSTLEGALLLAENAIGLEAYGLLVMPPYYYRYTDDQLYSFFDAFAKEVAGRTPLYLYNLPSCTTPISPTVAENLLRSGAFSGIKDSGRNGPLFPALKMLRSTRLFSYLVGDESIYLQHRSDGATGAVSGIAAAVPELMVALDRAIVAGTQSEAQRLQGRLSEFLTWVDRFPATVAIKQAAVHRGWPLNQFAFPLGEQTNADLVAFQRWLENWLPNVLTECA